MVMVYAGGHISGAHYNPAVNLAVLIRGRIQAGRSHCLYGGPGGCRHGCCIDGYLVLGNPGSTPLNLDEKTIQALVAEITGTFALAYVVLNVAAAKGTSGNNFYGLAIGFTVFALAESFGKISGGAFNPAVAAGASFMNVFSWSNIWIYLVGCFGGAALAVLVFKGVNPDDK